MKNDPFAPKNSRLPLEEPASSNSPHDEDEPEIEEESLELRQLLREVTRSQTRALIFQHLSATVIAEFAQHGGKRPRMMLTLPDRGSFPANADDIFELQNDLEALAAKARGRARQLLRVSATIPPENPGGRPLISSYPEPGEGLVSTWSPPIKKKPGDADWDIAVGTTAQPRSPLPGTPSNETSTSSTPSLITSNTSNRSAAVAPRHATANGSTASAETTRSDSAHREPEKTS